MKKITYISSFIVLGVFVQFFIHIIVEIIYIRLLISNFDTFGLGFSWATWFNIHIIWGFSLLIIGLIVGTWQGVYWWNRIYEKKETPQV